MGFYLEQCIPVCEPKTGVYWLWLYMGVFRILINIYDGAFGENSQRLLVNGILDVS